MKIKHSKGSNPLAKLFAETPSVESEAEYKKLMIMEEILKLMKEKSINRTQLAAGMGVAPSRITAMMSGSNNFTIETLVRAGRVLGEELHQTFAPMGKKVRWTNYDPADTHDAFLEGIHPTQIEKPEMKFTLLDTASNDAFEAA